MKCHFIKKGVSDTLLLVFTGWASDERIFPVFPDIGQDICVCSGYSTLEWDAATFLPYREIRVIAWSLGVFAANKMLLYSGFPVVQAIAVNGTLYPRDDEKGIPIAVYDGTEKNLTEENLLKFYRRMCISPCDYENFLKYNLSFPVDELKDTLQHIRRIQEKEPLFSAKTIFTEVIIGLFDRIFPPVNQQKAWENFPNVKFEEIAHYDQRIWKKVAGKE